MIFLWLAALEEKQRRFPRNGCYVRAVVPVSLTFRAAVAGGKTDRNAPRGVAREGAYLVGKEEEEEALSTVTK